MIKRKLVTHKINLFLKDSVLKIPDDPESSFTGIMEKTFDKDKNIRFVSTKMPNAR